MVWIVLIVVFILVAIFCFVFMNGADRRKHGHVLKKMEDDEQARVLAELGKHNL